MRFIGLDLAWSSRHAAYAELQKLLAGLAFPPHEPRLHIPTDLLARDTRLITPSTALKHYEDLLDAVMCAYIAFYYWWWGNSKVQVFGTLTEGYIVSPVFSPPD